MSDKCPACGYGRIEPIIIDHSNDQVVHSLISITTKLNQVIGGLNRIDAKNWDTEHGVRKPVKPLKPFDEVD